MAGPVSFRGKVALVTGAAAGLGLELARSLAVAGARVVLTDIDGEGARAASEVLIDEGHPALGLCLDVTNAEGWRQTAAQVESAWGPVDILCNNAGVVGAMQPVMDLPAAALRWVFETNVVGALNGVQTFGPGMRRRGDGVVLTTASMTGLDTVNAVADYSASKHALISLAEAWRDALDPHGVTVSVLCPGAIATGLIVSTRALSPLEAGRGGVIDPVNAGASRPAAVAMSPAVVAELALSGVRRGDFYIFTHAEGRWRLMDRVHEMLAAFDRLEAAPF